MFQMEKNISTEDSPKIGPAISCKTYLRIFLPTVDHSPALLRRADAVGGALDPIVVDDIPGGSVGEHQRIVLQIVQHRRERVLVVDEEVPLSPQTLLYAL